MIDTGRGAGVVRGEEGTATGRRERSGGRRGGYGESDMDAPEGALGSEGNESNFPLFVRPPPRK